MTTALITGDRLQCRIWCSDHEQASVNTVYFEVTGVTVTGPTDQNVADLLDAQIEAQMKALITTGIQYDGVQVRIANRLPLPVVAIGNAHAGPGTAGIPGLPRQTAGLLSIRSDLAGPGYRGRLYLPFPDASHNQNEGYPTPAYLANGLALATAFDTFTTVTAGGGTATLDWVIWSKRHLVMVAVSRWHMDNAWATMKKRGSFGRANVSPI